jgi:hypothetical protein
MPLKSPKITAPVPDGSSFFLTTRALLGYRLVGALLSLMAMFYFSYFQGVYAFNCLLYWSWFGAALWFVIGSFSCWLHLSNTQSKYHPEQLWRGSTHISAFSLAIICAIFYNWKPRFVQWAIVDRFTFVAHVVLLTVDLVCSRMPFEKNAVFITVLVFLSYIHLVWFTHYVLNWDWPFEFYADFYNLKGELIYIASFVVLSSVAVVVTCLVPYVLIRLRDKIFR